MAIQLVNRIGEPLSVVFSMVGFQWIGDPRRPALALKRDQDRPLIRSWLVEAHEDRAVEDKTPSASFHRGDMPLPKPSSLFGCILLSGYEMRVVVCCI